MSKRQRFLLELLAVAVGGAIVGMVIAPLAVA